MNVGYYHWLQSTPSQLAAERERVALEARRAARRRHAHRALPRLTRLHRDLAAIDEKLRPLTRKRALTARERERARRLTRRHNQVVDAIAASQATSATKSATFLPRII